ncbi:hypothetical protein E2I00_010206 [Balaenoptera physalus]|uniref:Uncharacterized protein n=1 Tax=Balaenoptera physalus TaxID=9770 RepID=A0A643BWA9_BALPH|nr:hypothetical protein E2I00_010206 [Balaenoptera physalus]
MSCRTGAKVGSVVRCLECGRGWGLGTELHPSLPSPESPSCRSRVTEAQQGSWPLVLTLIRGALMGAGFLLTYGLTWIYYTRSADPFLSREV